jgi:hypothetical protein
MNTCVVALFDRGFWHSAHKREKFMARSLEACKTAEKAIKSPRQALRKHLPRNKSICDCPGVLDWMSEISVAYNLTYISILALLHQ